MLELRPFNTLGSANHGWLNAHHHFSFAQYHHPKRNNWGLLRVWNDDEIASNNGFPPHSHNNMEIITYVISGAITHKDSLGNIGRTEAGDVQVMSAGTGIVHSEYNLEKIPTHLFQIWIMPKEIGINPKWGSKKFPKEIKNSFSVLASGYSEDEEALNIATSAKVLGATLEKGKKLEYHLKNKLGYLVLAKGQIKINNIVINHQDGLAIKNEEKLEIIGLEESEIVLVDCE